MKVKDIVKGFPEKKDHTNALDVQFAQVEGYNQALEEIGNLEIYEETLRKNGWVSREDNADTEMTSWADGKRAIKRELITHGMLNHKGYVEDLFKTHAK